MFCLAINQQAYPQCFISYCWANSLTAVQTGSSSTPKALGWGDPRKLKIFLADNGVTCWIDTEQMGQVGLCLWFAHFPSFMACYIFLDSYFKSNTFHFFALFKDQKITLLENSGEKHLEVEVPSVRRTNWKSILASSVMSAWLLETSFMNIVGC